MKSKRKNIFATIIAAVAVACAACGTALGVVGATAEETQGDIVTMNRGAFVRVTDDYAKNGIRFELNMQKRDYDDAKALDPDAVFGMFIAPADYEDTYGALTPENLTGDGAIYGWAEKQADGTYGKYTGDKTQIINLVTDAMDEKDGKMVWYASIVNILNGANGGTDNRSREFIGIGYMKTSDGYTFAERNDNVRSMTYLAQQAIEKNADISEEVRTSLYDNYVKDFSDTDVNYTVNYVYDDGVNKTAVSETKNAKLGSEVDVTPLESVVKDGFTYFTQEKELKSVAYANDKTQFTVNYKQKAAYEADLKGVEVKSGKVTLDGFVAESSYGKNETTLSTTENGLKVSGSAVWRGVDFRFSAENIKPETKYSARVTLQGSGAKTYLGVDYLNEKGTSYDAKNASTSLYRTEFTDGGKFWYPDGEQEIVVEFVTPHVKFFELSLSVACAESKAYEYVISSVELFERGEESEYGLTVTAEENGKNVPFGWLGSVSGVVGENYTLKAEQGNISGDVIWSSSNESVATVNDGTVTFKKSGKAEIVATLGAHKAYANFTVYNSDGSYSATSGNVSLVRDEVNPADFVLSVAADKQFKILQISDPQVADMNQVRNGRILNDGLKILWSDRDFSVYNKLKKTIEETKPDLILLAGDVIYGEFDDNGSIARELIKFFEDRRIFFAPVFGNHDNESAKGTAWQARQYLNSEYCLFARGTVTGNCNYSISVRQGEKWLSNIYMLDTNGCIYNNAYAQDNLQQGLYESTVNDMIAKDKAISAYQGNADTSDFACMHIPVANFYTALNKYGFGADKLDINLNNLAAAQANGDFGRVNAAENALDLVSDKDRSYDIGSVFAQIGVKNVLAGHCHFTNSSVVADNGVRYTFGLKAGLIPEATAGETGGTTFTYGADGFTAAHYYDNYADNTIKGVVEIKDVEPTNIIAYGETEDGYRVAYGGTANWAYIRFKTPFGVQEGKTYKLTVNLRVNSLDNTALSSLNIDDSLHVNAFLNNWQEVGVINGKKEYRVTRTFVAESAAEEFTIRLCCSHAVEQYSYDVEVFNVTLDEKDFSNNALTSLKGDTACTNERTETGWNIAWSGTGDWTEIGFNTKYSIVKNNDYKVTAKLRVNKLETAAVNNFYLDSGLVNGGGNACGMALTNAWISSGESGVYTLATTFTANDTLDLVLRLACNYNGTYSFDVELFDITLENAVLPPFTKVVDKTLVGTITESGAQYRMANKGGWATCIATTKYTLTKGQKYTVSFVVSDISDESKVGNIHFNSALGEVNWSCITTGTKNESGGYVCTIPITAKDDGILDWGFAVNAEADGLTFVVSDFTVVEAEAE